MWMPSITRSCPDNCSAASALVHQRIAARLTMRRRYEARMDRHRAYGNRDRLDQDRTGALEVGNSRPARAHLVPGYRHACRWDGNLHGGEFDPGSPDFIAPADLRFGLVGAGRLGSWFSSRALSGRGMGWPGCS